MPVITSQILKFVDLTKTQKSRYLEKEILTFLDMKKINTLYMKGYFIAKNSFAAEITLQTFAKTLTRFSK